MWVFGYGSLMWKVDFPFKRCLPGFIRCYCRRFWQGSEDHRGVPGKPGRVVTLIHSNNEEDRVWGVAYEISLEDETRVTEYLDYREKDGYEKVRTVFYPKDGSIPSFELLIYIGNETNPFFLGPASIDTIATQICTAEGPSGNNVDYVLNLAEAMRRIAPDTIDQHLYDIELAVRKRLPLITMTF